MKIAIPTEGKNISEHFGKCENFTLIEAEGLKVKSKVTVSALGNQHGFLPSFLASHGVNAVIAGGMGEGARQNLLTYGIQIISGINGDIDEAVAAYLNGTLKSGDAVCTGHQHAHAHGHEEGGCSCLHH